MPLNFKPEPNRTIEVEELGINFTAINLCKGTWKIQVEGDKYTYTIKSDVDEGVTALKKILKKRALGIRPT